MSVINYFKTAFLNHWNLLAFLGGSVFGLISGIPDVVLPLVFAGEIAYVGLLGSHPKFRLYVDAQEAKAARQESSQTNRQMLDRILKALPRDSLTRFESLRNQCHELRQIAQELKEPSGSIDLPLEGFQAAGLDRLLWVHLRLLYTQYALGRFLKKTRDDEIQEDIHRLEERIAQLPAGANDPQSERVRKALDDNLQTSRTRLDNLRKARDNYQLVQLEIERLENKIRSLSEMAINRQEPGFISSEVDHVAASMVETERTMNELQFATGLDPTAEEAPSLLEPRAVKVEQ
ncbi:MAG: hypothetical protein ACLQNE_23645 [Thermoguttaceae bacterium]